MEGTSDNSVVYHLQVENELRFAVGEQTTDVTIELLSGFAEIFGSELVQNRVYTFPPSSSVSVFSWMGCSLKLSGRTELAYVTSDTLMIIPVNLHACLEEMRLKAESENSKGPVSLVVGPTDVGKSSLCRILLNYAARLGRRPLYIDLDVGQSSASIPGTISILAVEKPSEITEGFNQQAHSVYPFGYKSPGHNIALYFLLIKKLGHLVQTRMKNANQNTRSSGIIIDTCGWVRGNGYNAITLAACAFEIDVLFVVEEEKLYLQLKKDMPACVQVVYVPKQDGVFERSRPLRSQNRDKRVFEYFYGSTTTLNPHSIEVKFSDVQVYKIAQTFADAVIDAQSISSDDVAIVAVPFGPNLMNHVLALSFSETPDENIMVTNIIGFVCVIDVDMENKILKVLSPQPGPLPSKILLMGDIKLRDINLRNY